MNSAPNPLDAFETGLTFEAYLSSMVALQPLMREQYEAISPLDQDVETFSALAQAHGQLKVLVLTEDDCGDAVFNLSIVARLAEAVPNMRLRIVRHENPIFYL